MNDSADEYAHKQPDELQDALVAYEIAAAVLRQKQDHFIAICRDKLHNYLRQVGYGDPKEVHAVLDILDEFLKRSKR
jgi:hypothetical protein